MDEFGRDYWEQRYQRARVDGQIQPETGPTPNPHLVTLAADLTPGRALEAGCGEGASAEWLAARGWQVLAVDVSETAIASARERVAARDDDAARRIHWRTADLTTWTPGSDRFDLVLSAYVHVPGDRDAVFRSLAAAVAEGGLLLLVGHDPSGPQHGHSEAGAAQVYVTRQELTALLDPTEWMVEAADTRERVAGTHGHGPGHGRASDHGQGHGQEIVLRDAVLQARRRLRA